MVGTVRASGQGWSEDLERGTRDALCPHAGKKCYFSTVLRTDHLEEVTLELTSENQKEEARGREFLVGGAEGTKEKRGRQEPYPTGYVVGAGALFEVQWEALGNIKAEE